MSRSRYIGTGRCRCKVKNARRKSRQVAIAKFRRSFKRLLRKVAVLMSLKLESRNARVHHFKLH